MEVPVAYTYALYEKQGRIAFVTINRPQVMNAVSYAANAELYDIWTDFMEDPEVWTAILTGAGEKAFCAGSDIKAMASLTEEQRAMANSEREASDSPFQEGGMVHREIWKPIIAAVNGYCLGGGLEIAMACDIVIASETARFGVPEIRNVGSYPGSGGIHRLPRNIPLKIAMQMLLTGEHITAEEALRMGLINKVVPPAQVMREAIAMADKINENSPIAARVTKEMVTKSLDLPLEYPDTQGLRAWDLDDRVGAKLRESEDWKSREGPRAFVDKRKPVWKGC
jgi:crotonobetainyl-CoA hydratase